MLSPLSSYRLRPALRVTNLPVKYPQLRLRPVLRVTYQVKDPQQPDQQLEPRQTNQAHVHPQPSQQKLPNPLQPDQQREPQHTNLQLQGQPRANQRTPRLKDPPQPSQQPQCPRRAQQRTSQLKDPPRPDQQVRHHLFLRDTLHLHQLPAQRAIQRRASQRPVRQRPMCQRQTKQHHLHLREPLNLQ